MSTSGATFLYDGDCAFCSACARFLDRYIPSSATIGAWQLTDLGPLGLSAEQCDQAVQWVSVDKTGTRHATQGPHAIADLLATSDRTWWRAVGRALRPRPVLAVAWPVYHWVSRNRHRLPGGTPTCSLPAAQRGGGTAQPVPGTYPRRLRA